MSVAEDLDKYPCPCPRQGPRYSRIARRDRREGLSRAEIAKSLDRSPNEIYRMLDRLVRRDYVRRTATDATCSLSVELPIRRSDPPPRHPGCAGAACSRATPNRPCIW